MTEQVERKKSYRWVSARQASYDGADWDSSDDSASEETSRNKSIRRGDTISKLPALPKLNYNEESESEMAQDDKRDDTSEPLEDQSSVSQPVRPQPLAVEDTDGSSSAFETPKLGQSLSRNNSKSSVQVRRTPVDEDLENLMAQISKEMTPKADHSDDSDKLSPVGLERGSLSGSDSEDELRVSKDGYFSKFIQTKDGDDYISDERSPSYASAKDATPVTYPVVETTSAQPTQENDIVDRFDKESVKSEVAKIEKQTDPSPVIDDSGSLQPSFDEDAYYSSDDAEDDVLSYTNSIKYQAQDSPLADRQSLGSEDLVNTYDDDDNETDDLDEDIRVSKSGYFSKMVESDSDTGDSDQESFDEGEEKTIPETIESTDESRTAKNGDEGSSITSKIGEKDLVEDEDSRSSKVAGSDDEQTGLETAEVTTTTVTNEQDGEDEQDEQETDKDNTEEDKVVDVLPEGTQEISSTRQSINLGKWKPDTNAFRNNFVQETSNNPPPGFVYDETGKLVDLTPSSMKPRVVSTYSEVESSWNAFPSEGNEDLETVRDTKTIYDNNTIYNVPGIISNNQNMPPLPSITSNVTSSLSSEDPKSPRTSTTLTLDGESRKGPLQTHFKEVFTVPEPNTQDIAKVTGVNAVPFVDMNKIVSSKNSHAYKIEQLRAYSKQLNDHNTGIQTWLGYTLKSSSKTDRDFIFDEYKVSKHVRDAYAHADELSKKHTVSNTVANVNQNVTHLTKKVFAHSKKSRGLFSSIGKNRGQHQST